MSRGINRVTLLGNVTREPELRNTQGGTAVANFSLACNERAKINGEWTDRAEFVSCVAWGKTAETAAKYLGKGSQVYLEGRLQTRKWEKDGQTRYSTEVVISELVLLGGKRREEDAGREEDGGFDPNDDVPW